MQISRRHWGAVSAAFITNAVFFGVWAARIPAVAERFAIPHSRLGLLLLLLAFGALLAFPLAGRLADRHGALRVTRILVCLNALAMVGLAAAPSLGLLAVALFVFGACHGAMDVAMNAWAAEVEQAAGKPWMPSFHAMWSLGAGFGALTAAGAVALGVPYGLHFLLAAALVPVFGLYGTKISWPTQAPGQIPAETAPLFSLPRGPLLFAGLLAGFATLGEGAVADWSALYLIEATAAQPHIAPLGLTVFSAAMVGMRLLGGLIIGALGAQRAGLASGIFALCGTTLLIALPEPMFALAGFMLMGFGYALAMPLAFSQAGNTPGVPPARAIASVATLGYGGMLMGPPMIGALTHVTTLRGAFGLLVLLALGMVLTARGSARRPRRAVSRG
ncbi:MFS transporter [Cognatishimia sp. SS12]|uniref:MFS transporter n=1 Tax=Cognatishimia sp. SS12 TaxID=2979465 RepID=UPI00232ABB2D|nr:MFS transporter [Cognatishimia sp. SS12]MDC0738968.1 MFS transporter [Cognatishimia sp. SS12]